MRRLDGERHSYLAWARANDDDAYRESEQRRLAAGRSDGAKKKPTIELYEYTREIELLADLRTLMQQNVHYTATHGSKAARKKPKISSYPTPSTSAKRLKSADRRHAMEAVWSAVVFDDEPYEDRPDLVTPRAGHASPERDRPGRMRPPNPARARDGEDDTFAIGEL